ncbi:MAG: flagellar biosynthetic protein FliO [Fuerstiella sp.]
MKTPQRNTRCASAVALLVAVFCLACHSGCAIAQVPATAVTNGSGIIAQGGLTAGGTIKTANNQRALLLSLRSQSEAADPGSPAEPFIDLTQPITTPQVATEDGINQDSIINLAIWMVVIMCLCGLTVLGLRRMSVRQIKVGQVAGTSRVVDTLNLGKHRFVQLIEIGGRSVLVASDASGIRSVLPMVDQFSDTLFEEAADSISGPQTSSREFSQLDR